MSTPGHGGAGAPMPERVAQALCALGRVDRLEDLGANGPPDASSAGGSLFRCLFGRDSIRMARDLLDLFPRVARATLMALAELQGVSENPLTEEQPGRILHEYRGPDDTIGQELLRRWGMPSFPYYGSVDATPDFVNLLVEYCASAGTTFLDTQLVDRTQATISMREVLRRAIGWITRRLDTPAEIGLLWARATNPRALTVQTWEDSADSMYFEDGSLLDISRLCAPVALQGYTYDALLGAAQLMESSPGGSVTPGETEDWRARAHRLRERTLSLFWSGGLGNFCLAASFDPDGLPRMSRVVSSAPGHLLASRLLDGGDARSMREAVAARLREPDLLAAAGIRTKSTSSSRFGPGTYHNGSTWPMDTGIIADGLRRHGFIAQADDLEDRILRACVAVDGFPEFFRGDTNNEIRINQRVIDTVSSGKPLRLEQPPQDPQGWTVTRVARILRRQGLFP
jgi:glycogen debranching enzyme